MTSSRLLLFTVVTSLGCKEVPAAPKALDDLTHFFFLEYDTADELTLVDGAANLKSWHNKNGDPEGLGGELTNIGVEHRRAVGLDTGVSFNNVTGVFELVEHPSCDAQDLANIYLSNNQMELFPGNYNDYGRPDTSGFGCFRDGSCDEAFWTVEIEDSLGFDTAVYSMDVEMKRIYDEEGEPAGILCRSWMPEEALVDGERGGKTFFDQSYTIEVFLDQGNKSLHHYGIWNSGGLTGISPDADIWAQQYLKGVEDWNDRIDELCADERSLWN